LGRADVYSFLPTLLDVDIADAVPNEHAIRLANDIGGGGACEEECEAADAGDDRMRVVGDDMRDDKDLTV